VTLSRDNEKVQLFVDKVQGSYRGAISSRDWVIRLNLPEKSKPENIQIDGKILGSNSSYTMKLISEAEQKEEFMPFAGVGSKPRPLAGPILELIIHQQSVQKSIQVSFHLK